MTVEKKKEKKGEKKERPLGHGKQKRKDEERFRKCRFHSDLYAKFGWSLVHALPVYMTNYHKADSKSRFERILSTTFQIF